MKLFTIKDKKLENVSLNPFQLEKEIQTLVENNLEKLFHLKFVRSEFAIRNFRIDTLAFDTDKNAFAVIEYKKGANFSVIDQGYTYMSMLLNNKADFILEYNEQNETQLKKNDVDWSQSKVIFISTQFTEFQKQSVNFKDVPFELWEIKRYENNLLGLVQHKSSSNESITIINENKDNVVSKVSNELKVYNEEYHLTLSRKRQSWVNEYYFRLKERILAMGEIEVNYNAKYINFRAKSHVVDLVFTNDGIYTIINMSEGTINDPDDMARTYDGKGHWGHGDYSIYIEKDTDLDYVMFLLNQSYLKNK